MQKLRFLPVTLLLLAPSAYAQFGWDEETEQNAATDSFDAFGVALRKPVIEPIRPSEPVVPVFQPLVAPAAHVDPLIEQCDLEPEVAQAYRAAEIAEDNADCPEFLGRLSDNPYDPDSVANPYGRYSSPYSPTSIKNPYSTYGSPYSSQSPNNPYATQAPLLFGD